MFTKSEIETLDSIVYNELGRKLEDEGVNYNYEKGHYATIPFSYNEAEGTLTLGERTGEFAGMLKERTFNVVKVSKEKPLPFDLKAKGTVVKYEGKAQTVKL